MASKLITVVPRPAVWLWRTHHEQVQLAFSFRPGVDQRARRALHHWACSHLDVFLDDGLLDLVSSHILTLLRLFVVVDFNIARTGPWHIRPRILLAQI